MKMLLVAVVLLGGRLLGWSCVNAGTACSELKGNQVVYIGKILANGGHGFGAGPEGVNSTA